MRSKDPLLVFLVEMKAGTSRGKGIQNKLEYMQDITVPSDGKSGGLAMLWQLLEVLRAQHDLSWIVFGDFNEIVYPNEKLGRLNRDAKQMEDFRECLSRYGLFYLGFIGQRFTWCNG